LANWQNITWTPAYAERASIEMPTFDQEIVTSGKR